MHLVRADAAGNGSGRTLEGPSKWVTVSVDRLRPGVGGLEEEPAAASIDMTADFDFQAVIPVSADGLVVLSYKRGAATGAELAERLSQIESPDSWKGSAAAPSLLRCRYAEVGIGHLRGKYIRIGNSCIPIRQSRIGCAQPDKCAVSIGVIRRVTGIDNYPRR